MDLERFSLRDMITCGSALRGLEATVSDLDELAARACRYLYENLLDRDGVPACALVRFYTTRSFGKLDTPRREFARRLAGAELGKDVGCLVLLGTAGSKPPWNDPMSSQGHLCIPLASEEVVRRSPMIAQLLEQLGVPIHLIVDRKRKILIDQEQKNFNVFHVPNALGSDDIPDQTFVESEKIRSVLGFGGLFPTGELFSVILFSRVEIPREVAEEFRPIAISLKVACLPHLDEMNIDA